MSEQTKHRQIEFDQMWDIISAIRESYPRIASDAPTDEIVEALQERGYGLPPTFGETVQDYVGRDDLPFLVRVAMGKAVKQVLADWEKAGEPQDVEELKSLFPTK